MGDELLLSHHLLATSFLYSLPTLLPTTFKIKVGHPFLQAQCKYIDSHCVHNSHTVYKAKHMCREVKRLLQHNMAGKCPPGCSASSWPTRQGELGGLQYPSEVLEDLTLVRDWPCLVIRERLV